MSEKKQFVLNFISQILFNLINLGVSFFLVPHIVETINATAYGFVNLANDFVSYAGIATIALNTLAGRYITIALHKKNYEEANKYFNSVTFANAIIAGFMAVLSIIFIFYIDKVLNIPTDILGDVRLLFIMIFINFIISIVTSNFSVATFTTNKLYKSSIINIVNQIIRCILLIVCYTILPPKVWYIGFISLLGTGFISIANIIYLYKLTPELKFSTKYFNIKYVIKLIKAGIWNTITRISSIINNGLDLLISNIMISSTAMGILALPRNVHSIILNLFASLGGVFAPKITISYANGNNEEIKNQINFSYKFLGVFSNTVLVVFISFGLAFFNLWVPTQDSNLLYLIAVVSCSAMIIALPMEPFYNVHTALNKIKIPALASIGFSVLTIILEFIGLSLTKDLTLQLLIISSTSTFIGLFRVLLFLPMYTAHILEEKTTYFYPLILKNTLAFIICLIIGLMINWFVKIDNWIVFVVMCAILALISFIITYFINFNKDEQNKFKSIIERKIFKRG